MAKIQRHTQKIFGGNAPTDDIAALGSFKTGTPVYTDSVQALQNEAFEQGYGASLVANEAPFLEEQNSVPYVLSKQLAYNFQEGIPEYDANTTYYIGSIVKTLNEENKPVLYYSIIDDNIGHSVNDIEWWKKIELGGGDNVADTSLSNLTPEGEKHFLNKTQIANCLLEVPQRIKYTLEDRVLTIKAGSVFIVPYGTENKTAEFPIGSTFLNNNFKVVDTQFADNQFFVWAELQVDKSNNITATSIQTIRFYFSTTNGNIIARGSANASGTSVPTNFNSIYYNTGTNYCYNYISGTQDVITTFPILICQVNGAGSDDVSVAQVFNGIGYIGSIVWADKEIKGLSPWGINDDGTYKNKEITTTQLVTKTFTNSLATITFGVGSTGGWFYASNYYEQTTQPPTTAGFVWYNPETNELKRYNTESGWSSYSGLYIIVCNLHCTNGVIDSLDIKNPFCAADVQNVINKRECKAYIIKTYQNGASWYRIWSDGWCEQGSTNTSSANRGDITFLKKFKDTNYFATVTCNQSGDTYAPGVYNKTVSSMSVNWLARTSTWKVEGYLAVGEY